jgi:hypothetical protein
MDDKKTNRNLEHTKVAGAINQHTPSYWRLALPALGVRYLGRYTQELFPSLQKTKFLDTVAGAWMLGVTTLFASRTKTDMQNILSEAVGYELGKEKADVSFSDIMHSQNKAVIVARDNFIKYTGIRALVNASFFASYLPGRFRNTASIDLGMGANSGYLVVEVLGRGRTFFEKLQSFTDSKLNQGNALGENVTGHELIELYERNALDNDRANSFKEQKNPEVWKKSQVIFERMADLMNHTYQHGHDGESANFTLPKFIYLLGNNLIQPKNVEQTLALIELSNTYGMTALKEVVKELKDGTRLEVALQPYPEIALQVTSELKSEAANSSIIARIIKDSSPESVIKRYMPDREKPAVAHTDKLAQTASAGVTVPSL